MSQLDKQTYLMHAKLKSYKRRIDVARAIVKKALDSSAKPILSFSAGKDSVCDVGYRHICWI